jgi:hypothetical protein
MAHVDWKQRKGNKICIPRGMGGERKSPGEKREQPGHVNAVNGMVPTYQ